MDAKAILGELEELAEKLGVDVKYDQFSGEGMSGGGLCKIRGAWRVIIDRRNAPSERAILLARCLVRFDYDDHFVSPQTRELLERQAELAA